MTTYASIHRVTAPLRHNKAHGRNGRARPPSTKSEIFAVRLAWAGATQRFAVRRSMGI